RERKKATEPLSSVDYAVGRSIKERKQTRTQRQPDGVEQTIFLSLFLRGFCPRWRAARRHGASARNHHWFSSEPGHRRFLFPFCHHRRHPSEQSEGTSGAVGLVSERPFHCAGCGSFRPFE